MAHWNYRRMKHVGEEALYAIHEVYYDDDGAVKNWSIDPIHILSDTSDFREVMVMIERCLNEPALDYNTGEEVDDE